MLQAGHWLRVSRLSVHTGDAGPQLSGLHKDLTTLAITVTPIY